MNPDYLKIILYSKNGQTITQSKVLFSVILFCFTKLLRTKLLFIRFGIVGKTRLI